MQPIDDSVRRLSQRTCDEYDALARRGFAKSTNVSDLIAATCDPVLKATLIHIAALYQAGKSNELFKAVLFYLVNSIRPTSVNQLVAYLSLYPNVRVSITPGAAFGIATDVRELRCVAASTTRLDWSDGRFLPLDFRKTPEAEASETGVEFDDSGFSVLKFGSKVRVDYLD